jgi:hypothetical protein
VQAYEVKAIDAKSLKELIHGSPLFHHGVNLSNDSCSLDPWLALWDHADILLSNSLRI